MNVRETANAIKSMEIRGAGKIGRSASVALSDFALSSNTKDIDKFMKELNEAKNTLLDSRPTAVSLWNAVHSTLKGVDKLSDVSEIKKVIKNNSDLFVKQSNEAVTLIGEIGAKRIDDGDVILTHCNSSVALSVIKTAFKQGKKFKVYATESRPWRQGILTVNELAKEGIDVTLIIDSAVRYVMNSVTKVFVGADTITSNGDLINKIGTSQLALAANESRVQFFVCSETFKFSSLTLMGEKVKIEERDVKEIVSEGEIPPSVKVFNPVFDVTPAKYISGIITEEGLISPGSVYHIMVRNMGEDILKK